jgi:Glycosyl hydrolase family 12
VDDIGEVRTRLPPALAGLLLAGPLVAGLAVAAPAAPAYATACPAGSISAGSFRLTEPGGQAETGSPDNWNTGGACAAATPAAGLDIAQFTAGGGSGVQSYPNITEGCTISGCTAGTGLPLQVGALTSSDTASTATQGSVGPGAEYDYSYDIWGTTTPAWSPATKAFEVMVWLNEAGTPPAGTVSATIDGTAYWVKEYAEGTAPDVYPYIQLREKTPTAGATLNLADILGYGVAQGWYSGADYLQNVQVGAELWAAYSGSSFGPAYLTTGGF